MSMIYCLRCEYQHDSDFVDCVEDPNNPMEMVCWDSLSNEEQDAIEKEDDTQYSKPVDYGQLFEDIVIKPMKESF